MFNWLKNWGAKHAIAALDNIEAPLGKKIQDSIDEFRKLDGYGVAKLLIDEVQSLLYSYFKITPPDDKKANVLK